MATDGTDWIFDVLADLQTFSERNGLDRLAASLEHARQAAEADLHDRKGADDGASGTG